MYMDGSDHRQSLGSPHQVILLLIKDIERNGTLTGFLRSFDSVIVYYDNGQHELTKLIASVFGSHLPSVEFRIVSGLLFIMTIITIRGPGDSSLQDHISEINS